MSAEFIDELPPRRGGDDNWARSRQLKEFAAELRANPGRWAKYPLPLTDKAAPSRASEIRNGRVTSFSEGKFEAAVRERVLYVRAVNA